MLEVPAANLGLAARGRQSLEGVLAHDFEHREPRLAGVRLALPHEALVDERRESFEHGAVTAADGLGRRKGAAAGEHGELRKELLCIGLEQVVAPVESHAKGLLVPRRVAPPACKELQTVSQPREQRCRRQDLRSRRGQLDRQWQPIELRAELGHRGRVLLAQREVRIGSLRAGDEELGRLVVGERRHRELALRCDMERRSARHDHLQSRRGVEEARDARGGRQYLFEVVDEEQ